MTYSYKLSTATIIIAMASFFAQTTLFTEPANASIQCNGPYQIVSSMGEISTPYCEDNYLAHVVQKAGVRISAKDIRNNPTMKEEACNAVSYDIRVQNNCIGSSDSDG